VALYHRHYALFERVLVQKGNSIKDLLLFFEDFSRREKEDLIAKTREWSSGQDARERGVSS
jgi:hypothetical protein